MNSRLASRLLARVPWTAILLALLLLAPAGCARRQSPLIQRIDPGGIPYRTKRVEQYPQRDYWHHFNRTAYTRPDHGFTMFTPLGDTQLATFKEWGRPDWVRKPFRSLENDRVEEWIYIDKRHVFQFVGTDLVYEGPLTDYEQTLLIRGFPDRAMMVLRENGEREDVFIYTKLFTAWLEQFKFRDGYIVESQEGN